MCNNYTSNTELSLFIVKLLYDRGIKSIPESIGNLTELKFLELTSNEISQIPESIGSISLS